MEFIQKMLLHFHRYPFDESLTWFDEQIIYIIRLLFTHLKKNMLDFVDRYKYKIISFVCKIDFSASFGCSLLTKAFLDESSLLVDVTYDLINI